MGTALYKKISTTIPPELYVKATTNGWGWKELIIRGMQHMETFPALLERVNKAETALLKLNGYIQKQTEHIICLEAELNKISSERRGRPEK